MPRLGNGNEEEEPPPSRVGDGSIAQAYPRGSRNASLIQTIKGIIIVFSITLFLRNLILKDYRTDELSVLKANGLSEDEINLYIPKTTAEKNQLRKQDITKHTSDYAQLKMDVATLKEQIKLLNEKTGIGETTTVMQGDREGVPSSLLSREETKGVPSSGRTGEETKGAGSLLNEEKQEGETYDRGSDTLQKPNADFRDKVKKTDVVEVIDSVDRVDSMERMAMG